MIFGTRIGQKPKSGQISKTNPENSPGEIFVKSFRKVIFGLISINEVIGLILAICGGISVLGGAFVYILKVLGWIRKPEQEQNSKLHDHEIRITKLEQKSNNDYEEIEELKKQNYLLLTAMLATIKHQINGDDVESLKECSASIEKYVKDRAIFGR